MKSIKECRPAFVAYGAWSSDCSSSPSEASLPAEGRCCCVSLPYSCFRECPRQRAARSCRSPSGVVRQVLQCFLSLAHSTGPCQRLYSSLMLLCRPFLWQPKAASRRLCRCADALLRHVSRPSCSFSMLSAVASFDTGWSVCVKRHMVFRCCLPAHNNDPCRCRFSSLMVLFRPLL